MITVHTSVPVPYILLPTWFGFPGFTGKQIKATKKAQGNTQVGKILGCFGKTLSVSASSYMSVSHPNGLFCCGFLLKMRICAWKLRASTSLKPVCLHSGPWELDSPISHWCFRSTITLWPPLVKLLASTTAAYGAQLSWSCSRTSDFISSQRQSEQAEKSPWLDNGDFHRQYCR